MVEFKEAPLLERREKPCAMDPRPGRRRLGA